MAQRKAAKKGARKSAKKTTRKTAKRVPARSRKAAPGDWREAALRRVRTLIEQAAPGVTEEAKWKKASNPAGVPVWSLDGMICTGETYKGVVKLTFPKGARLGDPGGLFNAGLDSNVRRAIDIHEGDDIDEAAFKHLIRDAVTLNRSGKKR